MRKMLYKYIKENNITLLHCDMFPFKDKNIIDLSLCEQNMLNVASGIAYTRKPVFIYGVCGFILYKGLEQIKYSILEFGSKFAPIILFNAGSYNEYSKFGKGHFPAKDKELGEIFGFSVYEFEHKDFNLKINELVSKNGFSVVRLQKDLERYNIRN